MPKLLAIIGTLLAALFGSTAANAALQLMRDEVQKWVDSADFHAVATEKVNARLRAANIAYQFADILEAATIREQAEGLAVHLLNIKLGVQLRNLSGASRDDLLGDLSTAISSKVNAECGSQIGALWPVQRFRDELGTELGRQLLREDLAPGGLFPQARISAVKLDWVKKMPGYRDPVNPQSDPVKLAQSRARQKKYRRTHKYVAVTR